MNPNLISINSKLAAGESFTEKKFWLEQFSNFTEKTLFPRDNNIKGEMFSKAIMINTLSEEIYQGLMKISSNSDTRILMVVLGTISVLLHKYTDNNDIVIGTTIMKQEDNKEFINTVLPIVCKLDDSLSFKNLLN